MKRGLLTFVAASTLIAGCESAPPAQTPPTPEAEAAVARYVEALGGADNLRRIETVRKSGTYVYNGLEHPLSVLQKRGGLCREEIEGLTQFGTATEPGTLVVRAYDGESGWVSAGAEIKGMPDEQLAGFVLDADLESPLVDFQDKGHSVELVGPARVEGVDVVRLDVRLAGGETQSWFLDAATHLPVMKSTEMGEGEFDAARTWFLDDYREVEGVKMPFYVMVEEMLFSREYILDEIEVNVPIDDALFAMPRG